MKNLSLITVKSQRNIKADDMESTKARGAIWRLKNKLDHSDSSKPMILFLWEVTPSSVNKEFARCWNIGAKDDADNNLAGNLQAKPCTF